MLTFYAPLLAYLLSFPVMLVSLARAEIGIIYFITLVPFIAVMTKFHLFPQGHNVPDFLLIFIIIGSFLNTSRRQQKIFQNSSVNAIIMLVILGAIINLVRCYTYNSFSAEVNIDTLKTWKNFMLLPILYYLSFYNLDREKIVKLMIICIALSLLGMSFNFHSTFRWYKTVHYSHDMRISGPFVFLGPNEMGIFFSMMMFLLFAISYFVESRYFKIFLLFVALCCLYPIVYSYSRSAYACVIVGTFIIGLLKDRRLLVLLCLILVFYRVLLPTSVVERIDMTFLDKTKIDQEQFESRALDVGSVTVDTVNRVGLWKKALLYFEEEPLLGIGFRAFAEREQRVTHSLFMQVLAEEGVIGLFIFLAFIVVCLRQAYKLFRTSSSKLGRGIGLGFLTCALVHLVGSIGADISLYYNMMCIYWVFLGIVSRFNIEYTEYAQFIDVNRQRVLANVK